MSDAAPEPAAVSPPPVAAPAPSKLRHAIAQGGSSATWLWRFFNAPGPHESRPAGSQAKPEKEGDEPTDWLHDLLLPLRPAYKQALMLSFLINLIALGTAVFSLQVYDRVVGHGGYSSLVALTVGMLVAIGFDHVLRGGRAVLLQRTGVHIEAEIARRAFDRLVGLPTLLLEQRPPAYWQSVFRDIEIVRGTCSGATALLLVDLPFLLLSLILIGMVALPVLPAALLIIIAFVVLAWRSGQVTRNAAEAERQKLVSRDAVIGELAAARLLLKGAAAGQAAGTRWETAYAQWMGESLERAQEADHYRDLAHGMTTLNTVVVTGMGALAILGQMMTMGALIAANILSGRMVAPLVQLVGQWRQFGQFQAARKRLDQLFALPLDRGETAVALPRPQGSLLLENVSFRYPRSEHDQLQALSGQLGPGGLHAIVGANGSGKTTLLKLLRGLYPPSVGRILLDGADLKQFAQADLARWVGYLPQQPTLISGSVRDNILLGDPAAGDEQIILAAERAGAHGFIVQLPDGYATEVGEGGGRFSGGERKRIAIAQVLLRDPPVLLLDEPTADLDREAEQTFIATLRALAAERTIIVVTHSPALLLQCNGIVVLEHGRLAAAGPASAILPRFGLPVPRPVPVANDREAAHEA